MRPSETTVNRDFAAVEAETLALPAADLCDLPGKTIERVVLGSGTETVHVVFTDGTRFTAMPTA
jgi:hypothetical protein